MTAGVDGLPLLREGELRNLEEAEGWLDAYRAARGGALKPSRHVSGDAMLRARFYCLDGTAYTDLQPGDGTSYQIVVHDLVTVQAGRLREKDERIAPDRVAPYPMRHYRERAREMGPCRLLGGEVLFAVPNLGRHGYVAVFGHHGPHLPYYLTEKLGCQEPTSTVLAAWLTVFCETVVQLRADGADS